MFAPVISSGKIELRTSLSSLCSSLPIEAKIAPCRMYEIEIAEVGRNKLPGAAGSLGGDGLRRKNEVSKQSFQKA